MERRCTNRGIILQVEQSSHGLKETVYVREKKEKQYLQKNENNETDNKKTKKAEETI